MIENDQAKWLRGDVPPDAKIITQTRMGKILIGTQKAFVIEQSGGGLPRNRLKQLICKKPADSDPVNELFIQRLAFDKNQAIANGTTEEELDRDLSVRAEAVGDRLSYLVIVNDQIDWDQSGCYDKSEEALEGEAKPRVAIRHRFFRDLDRVLLSPEDSDRQWVIHENWDERAAWLQAPDGTMKKLATLTGADKLFDYTQRELVVSKARAESAVQAVYITFLVLHLAREELLDRMVAPLPPLLPRAFEGAHAELFD